MSFYQKNPQSKKWAADLKEIQIRKYINSTVHWPCWLAK